MTIMNDEMVARLIGRTAGLECLAQITAMALFGPQTKRNASEVQEFVEMLMPHLRREAADKIKEASLDEVHSALATTAAYAVLDGALRPIANQVALIERIKLQDAPLTSPRN